MIQPQGWSCRDLCALLPPSPRPQFQDQGEMLRSTDASTQRYWLYMGGATLGLYAASWIIVCSTFLVYFFSYILNLYLASVIFTSLTELFVNFIFIVYFSVFWHRCYLFSYSSFFMPLWFQDVLPNIYLVIDFSYLLCLNYLILDIVSSIDRRNCNILTSVTTPVLWMNSSVIRKQQSTWGQRESYSRPLKKGGRCIFISIKFPASPF